MKDSQTNIIPHKLLTEAIKGAIHEQINGIDLGIAEDLAAVSNYVLLSKLGQAPSFSGIKEVYSAYLKMKRY